MVYWKHAFRIIIVTRLHAKMTGSKIASFRGARKAMLKIWCTAVANRCRLAHAWMFEEERMDVTYCIVELGMNIDACNISLLFTGFSKPPILYLLSCANPLRQHANLLRL